MQYFGRLIHEISAWFFHPQSLPDLDLPPNAENAGKSLKMLLEFTLSPQFLGTSLQVAWELA
jgi:hypothetical protein